MTQDQIILFALLATVLALLLWGRLRYEIVAFGALLLAVVLGAVPAREAFSGFGHPATLLVALVLIVTGGLKRSGATVLITRRITDSSRSVGGHIAIMGGVGGALSGFMNNFAALAMLMPIDLQIARRAKRPAGLTLMPLSYATVLGGMVTLIGTPPNIIIAGIREDALGTPFAMFDYAPVGLAVAITGIAFLALVGWRLLSVRDAESTEARAGKAYVTELTVPKNSPHIGRRVGDLYEQADEYDVTLLGLIRGGRRRYGTAAHVTLEAGDALVLDATPDALEAFRSALSLAVADERREHLLKAEGRGVKLVEVVVPKGSRLDGKTVLAVGLNWRQHTILMGISREGRRISKQMRRTVLRPGDILLLLTPEDQATSVINWLGVLPLADRGVTFTDERKSWLAIAMFAAALAAASFGLVYLPVALALVVLGYILTGILAPDGILALVDWPVVVLLASMIPLGLALETSGGTQLIAEALFDAVGHLPSWLILAALMAVTMTLTDLLNNNATTVIAAPIAIHIAQTLGVNPDPFLMAVAVSASCAFLAPIGDEANMLILGPGGYRFGDYWRIGLPLEMLIIAVAVPTILAVWPL